MEKKKSIFEKIIHWFKKLFGKQEQQLLQEPIIEEKIEEYANAEEKINENANIEEKKTEKEAFFELYSNVKNQNMQLSDLTTEELMKFNMMAEKEIEIKAQKIKEAKEENANLRQEIESLKEEEKRLQNEVNSAQS